MKLLTQPAAVQTAPVQQDLLPPEPVEISIARVWTPEPPASSDSLPVTCTVLLETAALVPGQVMVAVGEASSIVKFMTSVPRVTGTSILPVPEPSAAKV